MSSCLQYILSGTDFFNNRRDISNKVDMTRWVLSIAYDKSEDQRMWLQTMVERVRILARPQPTRGKGRFTVVIEMSRQRGY